MAVYVDDARHKFGRMIMCHMWADSLDELMSMADSVGVHRKWIQGHQELSTGKAKNASFVHFDVSLGAKARALELGAVLTDKYGPSEHCAKLRAASDDPSVKAAGERMLSVIASIRAR